MNQEEQKTGPLIGVIIIIIIILVGGFYLWKKEESAKNVSPSQASAEREIAGLEQEVTAISADDIDADLNAIETGLQ
ncbi:MAG: hypothetical protein AAB507_01545 [Patescibacteria group bacterium]